MPTTLGYGVVGAGAIGMRGALTHCSMDDVQDRVRLAAVCDPVPGRAAAAAEKFGVAAAYETYEEFDWGYELIESQVGSGDDPIVITRSYYTNSAETGKYKKLASWTNPGEIHQGSHPPLPDLLPFLNEDFLLAHAFASRIQSQLSHPSPRRV